jgi:hypothetical protein
MNERIKELMIQSDYPAPEIALRAQKLVELIVRECIDNVSVWENDSRNHISYMLKNHFGVSE